LNTEVCFHFSLQNKEKKHISEPTTLVTLTDYTITIVTVVERYIRTPTYMSLVASSCSERITVTSLLVL